MFCVCNQSKSKGGTMGQSKPERKRVVTTLREDLWRGLQVEAARGGCNANDILEELISRFLPPGVIAKSFPVKKVIRPGARKGGE
jgi:hypothetical protein